MKTITQSNEVFTARNYRMTTRECRRKHRSKVKVEEWILHAPETAAFALARLSATALNNQAYAVKATCA